MEGGDGAEKSTGKRKRAEGGVDCMGAVGEDKAQQDDDRITEMDILTFAPTKSTAEGVWQPVLGLVQMRKLKGNFWRKCGFTIDGTDFLYPEEALSLYERKSVLVHFQEGPVMNKKEFFEACLTVIPLSCYLVYAKLKALDYIVGRHKKGIRVLSGDSELYEYLKANPSHTLLDSMVSYDLFIDAQGFSKKAARDMAPIGYVVMTDGACAFCPKVVLKLLDEAGSVPVIFAVVTSTGHVILEEVTDATKSLKLEVPPPQPSKKPKQRKERPTLHSEPALSGPPGPEPEVATEEILCTHAEMHEDI